MGRGKKKKANNAKWSRKAKKQRTDGPKEWRSLAPEERTNPKWEAYYRAQNIVDEEGLAAMKEAFLQELPIAFRLNTSTATHKRLIKLFQKGEFGTADTVYECEGRKFGPPSPLPWYNMSACTAGRLCA